MFFYDLLSSNFVQENSSQQFFKHSDPVNNNHAMLKVNSLLCYHTALALKAAQCILNAPLTLLTFQCQRDQKNKTSKK